MLGKTSRTLATLALPALALASASGCNSREVAAVDPLLEREQLTEIPISINRDLDLIFIIDDSSSMDPNQDAIIANFPRFIEVLSEIEGGLPNVHIGVISTDVGGDPTPLGEPFVAPGCEGVGHDGRFIVGAQDSGCAGIDDQWIVDVLDEDTGERIRNYEGDLADRFTCMASLGTGGCGFEAPLEALRRALDHPDNQSFFRDDAILGVVILSDEDDGSIDQLEMLGGDPRAPLDSQWGPLHEFRKFDFGIRCDPIECDLPRENRCEGVRQNCEPDYDSPYMPAPEYYADILKEFKDGDESQIIVAGIIGEPEPVEIRHETGSDGVTRAVLQPSCDTSAGDADPGIRLEVFLNEFQNRESTSICDGDLSGPIEQIAQRFRAVFGSPCVGGVLRDAEPDEPGIQPECIVADVRDPGTDDEVEFLMPECDDGQTNYPCWYMEPQEECSDTPTGLALEIERGDTSPPSNTTVRARCVAEG